MKQELPLNVRVRLDKLSHSYHEGERRHAVLSDVTFDFLSGETVALRGRSGSGKSTLLNLIAGIDLPANGNIIVNGKNLTEMTDRDRTLFRRKHIGFVYQAFNLVPTLNVADNVKLILELNGVRRAQARARVTEVLTAVGLAERSASYPENLSGGEQQRVAIARAVVHKPLLLLADEPTGNLDDAAAASILRLLLSLRSEYGATLIMVTHSAAVAATCDRVLDLRSGQIRSTKT
ncbi:MAG: ABC transporter ATP-binding protein [Woeseia sp.]|nr:ABC transporter ATP-binding protein [Woeseia sp.]MBT8096802.1 ABC transporter ATP-binding protein [Woeseia sp.]NNE60402.1 ABC transporter ATP-binding protein [Woeseia sp.]NNL53793.1 ABC transporter ATP-binding protein [Woeseia sp.]